MSYERWIFVLPLALMLLGRFIQPSSKSPPIAPRQRKALARRRNVILQAYLYIPGGLLTALDRVDRGDRSWVNLPPGERDAELEVLLEWIANGEPGEVLEIISEIRRHYYNTGDKKGGDAMKQALRRSLKATSIGEREAILQHYEPYTREARLRPFWIEEVKPGPMDS